MRALDRACHRCGAGSGESCLQARQGDYRTLCARREAMLEIRFQPLEIPCSMCGVPAAEPCVTLSYRKERKGRAADKFHSWRVEDAIYSQLMDKIFA